MKFEKISKTYAGPTVDYKEIEVLVKEAKESYGSANPEVLGALVERLVVATESLLFLLKRRDQELHVLRTKVFGSSSEKKRYITDFVEDPLADEKVADTLSEVEEKTSKQREEELEKIKAKIKDLKAKARALEKKKDVRESKKLEIASSVPFDIIDRPLPPDLEAQCPLCLSFVKDKGVSHKATALDWDAGYSEKEYHLHKASCECGSLTFVMPGPDRGVEQTIFSPKFVAKILFDKFVQSLPFTRQAKAMKAYGIKISRDRLIGLALRSFLTLEPLIKKVREEAKKDFYQSCDESPIRVVIEGEKERRYIWCLVTDKAVSYEITEVRTKEVARKIIGNPKGVLTSDRLNIYWNLFDEKDESGCLSHCRRKYFYSLPSFPTEAIEVMNLIGDIYDVEREAKEKRLNSDQRLSLRQEKSVPILNKLKNYVKKLNPPPRSVLGVAKSYTLEHWEELTYFTKDGKVEADNNISEQRLRTPKLGWKNFLFAQSELGCDTIAGYYTLYATANIYGHDPNVYIADVLTKLNRPGVKVDLESLLPWNWKPPSLVDPMPTRRTEIIPAAKVIELARVRKKIAKLGNA